MNLKPCPFCGAIPALEVNHSGTAFTVECVNQMCRLQVKTYVRETEEAIVELWNTRAEGPAEQKTAHWDISCDGYYPFCSNCGEEPPGREMSRYCPNCGRKMTTRRHEDA